MGCKGNDENYATITMSMVIDRYTKSEIYIV